MDEKEDQQFCLKWNNYQTIITSSFRELLAQDNFVDVTLSCGIQGHTINAHRVVLSACSPYLREILSALGSWHHPVIILRDISYEDLSGIIEFIYNGEVSIDKNCLPGFLKAAENLHILGLTEQKMMGSVDSCQQNKGMTVRAFGNVINDENEEYTSEDKFDRLEKQKEESANEDNNLSPFEEEEEEALSETEIRESNLDSPQSMYPNLMFPLMEKSESSPSSPSDPGMGDKKTCPFCYQQLSWHALSRHIRDIHRSKTDIVTCQYCLKTFRNKNSLGCHIWRFHKRGKELLGGSKPQSIFNT